jgi:hypothetical protein
MAMMVNEILRGSWMQNQRIFKGALEFQDPCHLNIPHSPLMHFLSSSSLT